ncbi:type IV secretion system protein [Paraburkholderia sp. BR10882]|uniref:type IV secretion system protein n=1 Tax=unclassified Paraburkholderia TaxID=2615204 RepID=UPI0034CE18CD
MTLFTTMFSSFESNLTSTITTGAGNMISLISSIMSVCFLIYLLLITFSYWRSGSLEEPFLDFFTRMIGWVTVLTFGMNATYYTTYVVPFVYNLGDQLATAITGSTQTGSALDTLINAYATAIGTIIDNASGIEGWLIAGFMILIIALVGVPFIAIAAAYILLAKLSLCIILALGPIFICLALFPATRQFFTAWTAQAANYILLVPLYAIAAQLEINFATSNIPTKIGAAGCLQLALMGVAFIVISLSLPGLAASLAGGAAVSTNFNKFASAISHGMRAAAWASKGGKGGSGGSMKGK